MYSNRLSFNMGRQLLKTFKSNEIIRKYAVRKRFYKNTNIVKNDNKYEVILDQRRLKTPSGNLFTVESEPLVLAVATEWDSQRDIINQSRMHITQLCNTVIDNPNKLTKFDMVNYITNYLDTDTILFHANEDEDLYAFQAAHWDPVIDWFNKRYSVNLQKSTNMEGPVVTQEDKNVISKYLLSHNFAAIHGFIFGIDTLKSPILTMACVDKYLTPNKAALLSRLEEEYQLGHWGRVEWSHDLNQQELEARISAAVLFIYFNSQSSTTQIKQKT